MASRDLTRKFRERRNAKAALTQLQQWTEENVVDGLLAPRPSLYDEEAAAPMAAGATESSSSARIAAPAWVEAFREIEARCDAVECELRRIGSLRKRRLLVTFASSDEIALERELGDAAQTAREHLRRAERRLQQPGGPFDATTDDTDATARAKVNAKTKLAVRLQALARRYRREEAPPDAVADDEPADSSRRRPSSSSLRNGHTNSSVDLTFLTNGAEKRALDLLDARRPGEKLVTLDDARALEADERFLDERDKGIEAVARSVNDVAHIFRELAVLVIDQGTVLDRIDFNMEQVAERTRHATAQLVKADTNDAGAAKPVRCVVSLLGIIALLTALLIVKLTHGF